MKKTIWRDHPVFIKGCTGFLGSWLTNTLVNEKANVVDLIRDNTPQSHFLREDLAKKVKNVLKWSPTYSFENGLVETIEWYKKT